MNSIVARSEGEDSISNGDIAVCMDAVIFTVDGEATAGDHDIGGGLDPLVAVRCGVGRGIGTRRNTEVSAG